jgi:hypothetical protein
MRILLGLKSARSMQKAGRFAGKNLTVVRMV